MWSTHGFDDIYFKKHFVIITTYKNQNLDLLPEFISMKKNQTYGERIMHRVYQR